ncbi:TonB-dependent receptor [Dyella monticola]|nr:TonB-dependent receptor [Dyella monticola]
MRASWQGWMLRVRLPRILGERGWPASLLCHATTFACPLGLTLLGTGAALTPRPALAETIVASRTYAVMAGSLSHALDALAVQGDLQLVYAPDLIDDKITHGVSGRFTPVDALKHVLAGTGLTWKAINASTFVLEASPASHPVRHAFVPIITEQPRTLTTVNVSGSLIGNADIQTATPTTTITAEDIRARGFNNLADVLENSVLATGSVQGPQLAGAFTQGAQAVSLFGLSPEFTLILLDGKPVANFGRLYNGTLNFTNLSNFPIAMIDHIDVMPGGASSIYGSQAIGGVINIVTKSHMDGAELSARAGGYSDGGGANQRISGVYGHDIGAWHILGAVEFDNASPIWGYQRPLTAGDSGVGVAAATSVQAGILNFGNASTFTGRPLGYLTPPDGCATQLFGGSTMLVTSASPNPPGQYCGSRAIDGDMTFSNQQRSYDGMLKLAYQLDSVRFYGDAMVNSQQQRWFPGVTAWFPDDLPQGAIEDATTGEFLYPERYFSPEEMPGGLAGQMYRQDDLLYQADIGANGQWGDSGWDWDVYYMRTGDRTDIAEPLLITSKIDAFFTGMFGPSLGVDTHSGFMTYNTNYNAFFQAITPAQYASFTQQVDENSSTWINQARATLSNASLFTLPGGDAGVAALIEGGSEAWYEPIGPVFTQDDVFEHAAAGGGGERSHAATAFELNLPLLKALTIDLSGRYDHYALEHGSDNHKFTYKAGIEYRPFDTWLIRGNYTTSFKVPDLSSIFLAPTDYYTIVTDYYQCATAHAAVCGTNYQYTVQGTTLANPTLQPTSAQSWTLGTVWSPVEGLDLSVDYLRIAIQDEVVQQDVNLLLRNDAECLLGQLPADSATCAAAIDQVQRAHGTGPIEGITTYYANLANETAKSIMGSARYQHALFDAGTLKLQLDYNDMLEHDYQIAPGQQPINQLTNAVYSTEFKSIVSASLTWTSPGETWTSTLYGHRYGPSPNYTATNIGIGAVGAARVSPWITLNGSVTYRPTHRLSLSLLVNNLTNRMPPTDGSYVTYPYFNNQNYNIYGREIMLQADMSLGNSAR